MNAEYLLIGQNRYHLLC